MIALFFPTWRLARNAGRFFSDATEEADGPFRLIEGRFQGYVSRSMAVHEGADAAYAASRLAVRRGAVLQIAFTEAATNGEELGEVFPISEIWDFTHWQEHLRKHPEGQREVPSQMTEDFPSIPAWNSEQPEGLPVATLPWIHRNSALLSWMQQRAGIQAIDRQACGYATAAAEMECRLLPFAFVVESLNGGAALTEAEMETIQEAALEEFLSGKIG